MFERIEELAAIRKMTLTEVARALDWNEKTFYHWKKTTPSVDKVQKVAEYFGVTMEYLLNGSDEPQPQTFAAYYRVDVSDLTDEEKEEFERDMLNASEVLAELIRKKREKQNRG